jgi:hypothetical protein
MVEESKDTNHANLLHYLVSWPLSVHDEIHGACVNGIPSGYGLSLCPK